VGPVRLQRVPDRPEQALRISGVVDHVERRDDVVLLRHALRRVEMLEACAISDSCILGVLPGSVDSGLERVIADEARVGERLREPDGRPAALGADVGDIYALLELLLDAPAGAGRDGC
jgi:hypothetical protein